MIYWILLIIIAIIAYVLGSMSSEVLASNYVFHANLRRLGKGNVGLSNFRRVYGIKGLILLLLVEVLRDVLVVLIGGWILGIKDQVLVGRLFAGFCLIMGRQWPLFYDLRGTHATICLIVTAFCAEVSIGVICLIVVAAVIWVTRYVSLATVAAAFVMVVTSVLVLEELLLILLAVCIAVVILVRHIPALSRVLNGTELKLSFEEDISYKFDQRF